MKFFKFVKFLASVANARCAWWDEDSQDCAVAEKNHMQCENQLRQAKAERDAAVKELQKTKSVAFKAETSNGLCSGELTTY